MFRVLWFYILYCTSANIVLLSLFVTLFNQKWVHCPELIEKAFISSGASDNFLYYLHGKSSLLLMRGLPVWNSFQNHLQKRMLFIFSSSSLLWIYTRLNIYFFKLYLSSLSIQYFLICRYLNPIYVLWLQPSVL